MDIKRYIEMENYIVSYGTIDIFFYQYRNYIDMIRYIEMLINIYRDIWR